jgi:hypothetical protein
MDISSARQLVNYQPQDDAFELFNIGIQNRQRWYDEWGRGQTEDKKTRRQEDKEAK